jgi:hypothetical protein
MIYTLHSPKNNSKVMENLLEHQNGGLSGFKNTKKTQGKKRMKKKRETMLWLKKKVEMVSHFTIGNLTSFLVHLRCKICTMLYSERSEAEGQVNEKRINDDSH